MTFETKQLTPKYEKKWNEFVLSNDNSTFYHQIGWKNVVESIYKHKSYYFFAENDNGEIVGILPTIYMNNFFFGKRLISLPFGSYGGVCTDYDFIAKALINKAIDLGNRLNVDYCEFRNINSNITLEHFSCRSDYSTFFLDLSKGTDFIWNSMSRKTRNMIRKGEKSLKFDVNSNLNSISEFYDIYSVNLKRLGTPVHDYRFFKKIYEIFPDQVFISKASLNGDPISSVYLLKFKDSLISGWGASDPYFWRYSPNNFIYWNSIKYASKNNYLCFDFGRSLSESGNEKFKIHWGTIKVPLSYYYYPTTKMRQAPQNEYGKFATIWSRLPLSLTNRIGPSIRKSLP